MYKAIVVASKPVVDKIERVHSPRRRALWSVPSNKHFFSWSITNT